MTEGSTHTHLRPRIPSQGTSIQHMLACLLDFILHHNLHVGTFNPTGEKFQGHNYIWLSNEIQELEITISAHFSQFCPSPLPWVNGNLYKPTNEVLSVLPLPTPILEKSSIQPFVPSLDQNQKQEFLAQLQGTHKAVLPIHTIQEQKLFTKLMATCKDFYISRKELSSKAVQIWNRHVDIDAGCLSEQLAQYANGNWEKNSNLQQSLSLAFNVTSALKKMTRDPKRAEKVVHATEAPLQPNHVSQGLIELPDDPASSTGSVSVQTSHPNTVASTVTRISQKRTMEAQPEPPKKKPRISRHCIRCGGEAGQCNGASAWYRCQHACRDCGQRSVKLCIGRNSKNPGKARCECPSLADLTSAAQKHLQL
ncbi:hypothetical protein GYMLUDRAFT_245467 [Collybiopsis luxurians FD-317 M1]|uniref:Uncharacterized protein n=1 Tax=Collybiopsis luxurians FD-317 M1 TaxID=944289 RepID=A0A0D0CKQ6_9AGAR|nr:hypothetical protein GYMLUDRAFT_245467 [Collybiopsis luxurians FD-317 M1]